MKHRKSLTKIMFFNALPETLFTTREAIDIGKKYTISQRAVYVILTSDAFIKVRHGEYIKVKKNFEINI